MLHGRAKIENQHYKEVSVKKTPFLFLQEMGFIFLHALTPPSRSKIYGTGEVGFLRG
jgi:hypothetical protein